MVSPKLATSVAPPFADSPNPAIDEMSPSPKPVPTVAPPFANSPIRRQFCCRRRRFRPPFTKKNFRLAEQGDISFVAVADFGRHSVCKIVASPNRATFHLSPSPISAAILFQKVVAIRVAYLATHFYRRFCRLLSRRLFENLHLVRNIKIWVDLYEISS